MSISKTTFLLAVLVSACLTAAGRAEDLATTVAGRLRDSGALTGYRVNVKSKSGTVWLDGHVTDDKQLATAVGLAESTPGVERVVNRLVIETSGADQAPAGAFAMPFSVQNDAGVAATTAPQPVPEGEATPAPAPKKSAFSALTGLVFAGGSAAETQEGQVELVQNTVPVAQPRARRPMPIGTPTARPMAAAPQQPMAMRTSMQEPMTLPGPGGYPADGQVVPGSVKYSEGYPAQAMSPQGMPPQGMAGGPMPMPNAGVGMPPVPMRGGGPNMPNYAWPSYAAYPNYAALQYPTQYSPTAWPYIGPFYPYPQVPLGWRRVSLEWDDGWWWLDFDERHYHSHHK